MAYWYNLSEYHLKAEAWQKNDRYYLVVTGDIAAHEARLRNIPGGRRIALFSDPGLPAWVFSLPSKEQRKMARAQWRRQFPKMAIENLRAEQYVRPPEKQRKDLVREIIGQLQDAAQRDQVQVEDVQAQRHGWRFVTHVEDGRVLESTSNEPCRIVVDESGRMLRQEPLSDALVRRVEPLYARVGPVESMDTSVVGGLFLIELRKRGPAHKWSLESVQQWLALITGEPVKRIRELNLPDRAVQEALEDAVMRCASGIAHTMQGEDDARRVFDAELELYAGQPIMSKRSTSALALCQYSTPVPIAWCLQYATALTEDDRVLEPTIGTGSLVGMANPDNVIGWEIDERRARMVAARFPHVRKGDFLQDGSAKGDPVDVVLANPPFSASRKINEKYDGVLQVTRIDRLMALRALEQMKDDGRAALILAGENPSYKKASRSQAEQHFFNYLYDYYNVLDHYNVDGRLYSGQGTKYDIQVIVIRGRKPEPSETPVPDALPLVTDYDELFDRSQQTRNIIYEYNNDTAKSADTEAEALQDLAAVPGGGDDRDLGIAGAGVGGEGLREEADIANVAGDAAGRNDRAIVHGDDGPGDRRQRHPGYGGAVSDAGRSPMGEWAGKPGDSDDENGHPAEHAGGNDRDLPGPVGAAQVRAGERGANAGATDLAAAEEGEADGAAAEQAGRREAGTETDGGVGADGAVRGDGGGAERDAVAEVEYANRLQARYHHLATAPTLNTNIPANLELPVRQALERVESRHGNLVNYVANAIQISEDQLCNVMYAEQIDALALALDQYERGRGFVLGDMTGVGKTRVLVGLMARSLLDGKTPVFITHKPTLFEDILREAYKMGLGQLLNPAVINRVNPLYDENGELMASSVPNALLAKMYEAKSLFEYNSVFITYSQLNQVNNERALWLQEMVKDNTLILDESHQAGGRSNTGENVFRLSLEAGTTFYSSATYAKRPDNYRIYHRVMGERAASANFVKAMQRGGEPLQEVISSMLAEDGTYIRREHDYSHAIFSTLVDEPRRDEHRKSANQLARILNVMTMITGELNKATAPFNDKYRKEVQELRKQAAEGLFGIPRNMGIHGNNFASRLWNLSRQFMLAMKVDSIIEQADKAIREGRAPIIFVDNTMESFIKEVLEIAKDMQAEAQGLDALPEGELPLANFTFADVLRGTLRKLFVVTVTDRYGETSKYHLLGDRDWEDNQILKDVVSKELLDTLQRLNDMVEEEIRKLPKYPLSPIDAIHAELARHGHELGELSGRNIGIDYQHPIAPRFYARSSEAKDYGKVITKFNFGVPDPKTGEREFFDGMIVTRAGAIGISLNASNAFNNQKQREMILPQAPLDINDYIQLLGRIYRANMDLERVPPIYTTLVLDLPSERRPAALLMRKQAALSANTTSNAESFVTLDALDMMNWLGDKVAGDWLGEHPDVAYRLDLSLGSELKALEVAGHSGTNLMSRLTSRGVMLPCDDFEEMYAELEVEYQDLLEEVTAKHGDPFRTQEHDLHAREVARIPFEGDEAYGTVFDAPIFLSVVEYDWEVRPMQHQEVLDRAESSVERHGKYPLYGIQADYLQAIGQRKALALARYGVQREDELTGEQDKAKDLIAKIDQEKSTLLALSDELEIGSCWQEKSQVAKDGLIRMYFAGFVVRDEHRMGYASNYYLRFAVPGEQKLREISLLQFMQRHASDKLRNLDGHTLNTDLAKRLFDEAPNGTFTQRRCILTGNLLAAAEWSHENRLGSPAVLVMEDGARMRGIALPLGIDPRKLLQSTMRLNKFEQINNYFDMRVGGRDVHVVFSPETDERKAARQYVLLSRGPNDNWDLVVMGRTDLLKKILKDQHLTDLAGGEEFEGRSKMAMRIYGSTKAKKIVEYLYGEYGVVFSTPNSDPDARYDYFSNRGQQENIAQVEEALIEQDQMLGMGCG